MVISEGERQTVSDVSVFTIKNPSGPEMIALIQSQRNNPEKWLTMVCEDEVAKRIYYEVIDKKTGKVIIRQLKQFLPHQTLRGEIIVHKIPKA